jgi:hypothetical protein
MNRLTPQAIQTAFQPVLEQLGGLMVEELRHGEVVVFRNPVGRLRHVACHDGDAWICACCEPGQCPATMYLLLVAMKAPLHKVP